MDSSAVGVRYKTPLQILRELIGLLRWNTLMPRCEEHELWMQMRTLLHRRRIRIENETWMQASQLIWLPDQSLAGGISEFAYSVDSIFRSSKLATEFWAIGMLSEPRLRTVGQHVHMDLVDLSGGRHPIRVPVGGMHNMRDVEGPYLVMAMGTVHPITGTIEFHQAVVEAILRSTAPVPVESSYERTFFDALLIRALPFIRPLDRIGGTLDPDALMTDDRIFWEVFGRGDAEYVRRKGRARRRIEHAIAMDPAWQGWRYAEWAPGLGEGVSELLGRLPRRRR